MKIEFDVQMTTAKMYDYMLKHTLGSFSGIIGELVGLLLILYFALYGNPAFLIAGIIVVLYLPVVLYLKSKRQVSSNEVFKEPLHYILDDNGITVISKEQQDSLPWSAMYRVKSTTASIILYTNKINACIFPKADLGDKKDDVIKMISTHVDAKKVNIR